MSRRRAIRSRRCLAAVIVGAFAALPSSSRADPSATAGITIGAAGEGIDHRFWKQRTAFHLGLRGDVLFLRNKNSDIGIGPYLEVMTHAFDEVQFGGGGSACFPVIDTWPIILSFGAYGRKGSDFFGLEPGIVGTFLWGPRSYNYHSPYVMSGGLLVETRYGLGASGETSIVVGIQFDLGLFTVPAVFLINAIKGGSHATDPVR